MTKHSSRIVCDDDPEFNKTIGSNEKPDEACEDQRVVVTALTDQRIDTWHIGEVCISRSLIVYILQVLVIYIVIITSIYNLTRGYCSQSDQKLWVAILSSCIGYLLPNPTLSVQNRR